MRASLHPFHQRSRFGLPYEKLLQPVLESILQTTLHHTDSPTDTMDFWSDKYFVEVKTRTDNYHYTQSFIQKDGWILPFCKMIRAKQETAGGKKVVFFYYWTADKSLWRWDYDESILSSCKTEIPFWHRDKQQQIFIPENHWTRVL